MANFQLPGGEKHVENADKQGMVWLHTGNKVTLDFIAPGPPSGADKRDVISRDPKTVVISNVQRTRSKITFTVSAIGSPAVVIDGIDGTGKKVAGIAIFAGDFKNQPGMAIDLLADICRGPDAAKMLAVQRLLFSQPDNIFDQNNNPVNLAKFGKWGCGKIVKASGTALFDQVSEIQYENPYHEPLDVVKQRTDVKYKSATIAKAGSVTPLSFLPERSRRLTVHYVLRITEDLYSAIPPSDFFLIHPRNGSDARSRLIVFKIRA